ncbi:MAG: glutamine-hydrolyzing carbamoyl-phosphate synthase small subunit [Candidatus Aenigmarchaeota archaeon]|nr:glutamine-hydrolyzing carbamoyl-phosphate synthase small subunit [Candidatus Aenigmarchaeota archaeon]
MRDALHAALVLRDGSAWRGNGFGAPSKVTGEVVFNTGMVGYTQSVTDCSYKGQILCQTYPLIGNYGISREEFESTGPQIQGYAAYEACRQPSHHTLEIGLDEWLRRSGVPGIQGIDTRELTKRLRMEGTMLGVLSVSESEPDVPELVHEAKSAGDPNERDLVGEVTIKKPVVYPGKGKRVVVIDCGAKLGIIRSLTERGAHVIRVPASYGADKIMGHEPDGVLLTNGPGDPKKAPYVVESVRGLIEHKVPLFGICLGNQILGLALGCDTYKMKFGHRGQNHPVMDRSSSNRCYITSQNHGYTINPDSVRGKGIKITFVNVNDGTVEGIRHERLPIFGVQFHPEARPGPVETNFLFDKFLKAMGDGHAKG